MELKWVEFLIIEMGKASVLYEDKPDLKIDYNHLTFNK